MKNRKWIRVLERKPEDGVMKLMCDMKAKELKSSVYVGWFAGGVEVNQIRDRSATHWMDLPDFPKDD